MKIFMKYEKHLVYCQIHASEIARKLGFTSPIQPPLLISPQVST